MNKKGFCVALIVLMVGYLNVRAQDRVPFVAFFSTDTLKAKKDYFDYFLDELKRNPTYQGYLVVNPDPTLDTARELRWVKRHLKRRQAVSRVTILISQEISRIRNEPPRILFTLFIDPPGVDPPCGTRIE